MGIAGLEINDAGVVLGMDGRVLVESPGYALEDDAGVWIGEPARARARLSPRLVNHTFWDRLDDAPATRPVGHARTHADLVALHLQRIWEHREAGAEAVVLAVPGSLSREQLGLLLGVAEAISLPVHGLVDRALAALGAVDEASFERCLHVEVGLHGVFSTLVERRGELEAIDARRLDAPGLLAIDEALAMHVAARFVRETRFDPRHSAESEQALYSGLRGWLQRLDDAGSTRAELSSTAGARHVVEIETTEIEQALAPALAALGREIGTMVSPGCQLALGHQLGAVPFAAAHLGAVLGREPLTLQRGAPALGAARHATFIGQSGGPRSLTRRLGAPASAGAPGAAAGPPPRPTHVVHAGLAHPIAGARFAIGRAPGALMGLTLIEAPEPVHCVLCERGAVTVVEPAGAVMLNGRMVVGAEPVSAGDTLGIPGTGLELLLVTVSDGASA